ncbi:MAG: hypothetical protein J6Y99_11740 [Bacteroidales bacterium]|nr:hypothetical protein [Bacteroidales bacterium]
MKKITAILIFAIFGIVTSFSQNLKNWAISPNGERGEILFPENEAGDIELSGIVEIPLSADSLRLLVNDQIMKYKASKSSEAELTGEFRLFNTYDIQLNIGEELGFVEVAGSPVLIWLRDKSHVKFTCKIEFRNNKFKYTLSNFETNRNTLPGEAKNDGQPNIIHWQRVNSMKKFRDSKLRKDADSEREELSIKYYYNSIIANEAWLYIQEYNRVIAFEEDLKNLKNISGDFDETPFEESVKQPSSTKKEESENVLAFQYSYLEMDNPSYTAPVVQSEPIDWKNYHGFLLSKGNNVFVTGNGSFYEMAGREELVKQIILDGFWNVVKDKRYAHFIIEYYVDTTGKDRAYIRISDGQGKIVAENIEGWSVRTDESIEENQKCAQKIYNSALCTIVRKIMNGKIPYELSNFVIE